VKNRKGGAQKLETFPSCNDDCVPKGIKLISSVVQNTRKIAVTEKRLRETEETKNCDENTFRSAVKHDHPD
jgi:hypothetical protein